MNPKTCIDCSLLERDIKNSPIMTTACGIEVVICTRTGAGWEIEKTTAETQAVCIEEE